jgi:lysyl-tRNA synthetase class II
MNYNYNTPEQAIISLENAYSKMDIVNVFASKDFEAEAKIVLQRTNVKLNEETIAETAKLLEISLVEHIQNNGFPDFTKVSRQFSELNEINQDLYFLEETLIYENGKTYKNIVFLTVENKRWKIAMIELR